MVRMPGTRPPAPPSVGAGGSRLLRALAAMLRGLAAQAPIRALRAAGGRAVSATATKFVERELGLRPPTPPSVRRQRRVALGRAHFEGSFQGNVHGEMGRLRQQVGSESARLQDEVDEEAARLQDEVDEEGRRLRSETGGPIDRWQLSRPPFSRRELLKLRRRTDQRGSSPRGREA
jgi:hypothetical protein